MNGEKARLWRADHAFQAAALPDGEWREAFLYRPRVFFAGMWIAALAASLLAAAGLRILKRP